MRSRHTNIFYLSLQLWEGSPFLFTIGTAGHIDHGKSALVEALTGAHPDRLPEEKRRGMTIDLGFASLTLPGGDLIGIVDVPGHERFVRHMVAGVGGIDAVLLVVAVDEGVMPQTREHLDIINLMGIDRGVVALTKSDLIDDEDWIELVTAEVLELLDPTSLRNSSVVPVSALQGRGLEKLLAELDIALAGIRRPNISGDPRLPVDRSFSVTGFGTVVTGTLRDGFIEVGAEIEILPRGGRTRVRGIQMHGLDVGRAEPGARAAINLAGVAATDLPRGTVLAAPDTMTPTRLLDTRLQMLPDALFALRSGREIAFHTGTSEVRAAVRLLESDVLYAGQSGWAQIRARSPLVVRPGDHFIIRQLSPAITLGGGVVVAPRAARIRRHDQQAIQRLERLTGGSPVELLLATLEPHGKLPHEDFARRTGLPESEFAHALGSAVAKNQIVRVNSTYFAGEEVRRLSAELLLILERFHAANPLRPGMPREELRNQLGLSSEDFVGIILRFADEALVGGRDTFVALPGHTPSLASDTEAAVQSLLGQLSHSNLEVPPLQDAAASLGIGADVLQALEDDGRLIRITTNIGYERATFESLVVQVGNLIEERGRIDVAGLRDHFGSSRKYCLALLEHLDSIGVTRRVGDDRVLRIHRNG